MRHCKLPNSSKPEFLHELHGEQVYLAQESLSPGLQALVHSTLNARAEVHNP